MTGTLRRAMVVAALLVATACGGDGEPPPTLPSPPAAGEDSIQVTSPAFREGQTIPVKYTCDGADVSPPLEWSGVPEDAGDLLLTVIDLDSPTGGFTHWIVSGIEPATTSVPEGSIPPGAVEGTNDFGDLGWGGPCPPEGDPPHNYEFTVGAVARPLELDEGSSIGDLIQALEQSKRIGSGQLTVRYGR